MAGPRQITLELLPHECAALLRWNFARAAREQLEASVAGEQVTTIQFSGTEIHWLAGDLTHAIVKRKCRDQDVFDLSERLDYVNDSSDGSLEGWYGPFDE